MVACNDCFSRKRTASASPSEIFERNVADKSITHQHIGLAVEQIASLNVAHEIQVQVLDQLVSFAR